jgi:ABC-2 type transport system ATP-binding protein
MDAIAAEGVEKAFGATTALAGADLAAAPGEVLALVGPNGAGKTTLVRCLVGTAVPDAGRVELFGAAPRDADPERVGYLPQSYDPPARLTARELVAYHAALFDDARDPDEVLAAVGFEAEGAYESLSGGERRRACVATAVVNDPDALFLDEPTSGIDPAGRRSVREAVGSLAGGGTTVLVTTHDMTEAARLADRVAVLVDGRVVATGTSDALAADHAGPPELRVETDAGAVPGFDARREDGELVVRCAAAEVADAVRALDGAGAEIHAIEWHEPTLEDVYLELAGDAEGDAP